MSDREDFGFSPAINAAMLATVEEAVKRQTEFWNRHGISEEDSTRTTGLATEAHRAWVKAVEYEYSVCGKDVRVHLDTPLARKAFILGYRDAQRGVDRGTVG